MTLYTTPPFIQKSRIAAWEQSPFVFDGDLYRAGFERGWTSTAGSGVIIEKYEPTLGVFHRVGRFDWNRYLGCAFVHDGKVYVTGTTDVSVTGNKIYLQEIDPATWTPIGTEALIATAPAGHKYYNSSLTYNPDAGKFVMMIETDEGVPFSFKAVQSTDLVNWSPMGVLLNSNYYSACPTVRYVSDGWYLVTFMFQDAGHFVNAVARTQDFNTLPGFGGNANLTPYQQIMAPDECEGVNNSDIDFIEWDGKVYFTYLTGDQQTWAFANDAWYDGTLLDFYHEYWA